MNTIRFASTLAALSIALSVATPAFAQDVLAADAKKHAISMTIESGDRKIASPKLLIFEGRKGTIELGEKQGSVGNPNVIRTQSLRFELTPTTEEDDKVKLAMAMQVLDETSGDAPSRTSREIRMVLSLTRGKPTVLIIPENSLGVALNISVQVDAAQ